MAVATQGIITWYTLEKDPQDFAYLSGQLIRLANARHVGWPSIHRLPTILEMFCYYFAFGFCTFPLGFVLLPFKRSYDPINRYFAHFFPYDFLRKLASGLIYGFFALLLSISCCVQILVGMICCYTVENIAEENYQLTQNILQDGDNDVKMSQAGKEPPLVKWLNQLIKISFEVLDKVTFGKWPFDGNKQQDSETKMEELQKPKSSSVTIIMVNTEEENTQEDSTSDSTMANSSLQTSSSRFKKLEHKFKKLRHLHNQLCILVPATNRVCEVWNPGTGLVGMVLAVISNFGMVKFSENMEIPIVAFLLFNEVLVIFLIGFFCKHALKPRMHTEEFIRSWKLGKIRLPKTERKQVSAMREVFYRMGPFFKVSSETKVSILETIQDYTIDSLLS
ncbi:unnamed protein product [Orchesella dallaii]